MHGYIWPYEQDSLIFFFEIIIFIGRDAEYFSYAEISTTFIIIIISYVFISLSRVTF